MFGKSIRQAALGVAIAAGALALAPAAHAENDFLSALFGAFGGGRSHGPEIIRVPYASEGEPAGPQDLPPQGAAQGPRPMTYGGGQAFCVRSCDGRYFPLQGSDRESRAASCNSFCPASKTEVVYGSHIDDAATASGKPYSELPNAFRYRTEIVAGCSCNGKDQFGLAPVRIEDDATVRRGDLVAGADGLMVAGRSADKRGASLNFTPASKSVQSRYQRLPVVARE
ncbi:DUF2865 domain-containing protein [Bradyrhizobium sp.]|uniref:DUF2865 domain-containing protein n=1 Tax=Bradyrhizobium sp. TaxID=376 RepID=UPI0025C1D9EB|nr:DUF2865 domain-containing protein [Bradyrhizobium sp.]